MSVLEAVTLAGDSPPTPQWTAPGSSARLTDATKITSLRSPDHKDGDRTKDMLLKPNDVIFIPESFF